MPRHLLPLVLVALIAAAAPASAKASRPAPTTPPAGWDVSYPQCGAALPATSQFAVVGVDGGRVWSANACLSSELAWASRSSEGAPQYYVNTGNPGPRISTKWPSGQQSPRVCAASYPANDSVDCAYDYGWNAAADSYSRAVTAASSAGVRAPAASAWWLDVETGNSWETLQYGATTAYQANDRAALDGQRAYLRAQGVSAVGVYSTSYQWGQIVGGAGFDAAPAWYAGAGSKSTAQSHCAVTSFTGGPVVLAQYAQSGYDADLKC
ncbi:MAG: hypothetical protein QOJ92_395 [Frankiales bacterium]|nr:hypothetical protein [Frankiales bacterium]